MFAGISRIFCRWWISQSFGPSFRRDHPMFIPKPLHTRHHQTLLATTTPHSRRIPLPTHALQGQRCSVGGGQGGGTAADGDHGCTRGGRLMQWAVGRRGHRHAYTLCISSCHMCCCFPLSASSIQSCKPTAYTLSCSNLLTLSFILERSLHLSPNTLKCQIRCCPLCQCLP